MTTSDNEVVENAGASTDQHVSGFEEEGSFITDEEPTATTPSHGSSNAGINETKANRQEPEVDRR